MKCNASNPLRGFIIGSVLIAAFFSLSVSADEEDFSFKKLLMPGPVIEGHVENEQQCDSCHVSDESITQSSLCSDCHEDVALDIKNNQGFHGRFSGHENSQCSDCHSEHLGREGDIINLDKDSFDHSKTDFDLTGEHSGVICSSCHVQGEKFSEAPSQCFSCHESDDQHKGAFGTACQDCHSSNAWQETTFDHGETRFPLLGEHRKAQCSSCHPDQKYEHTPTSCVSCHAINDVHGGANGDKCAQCHNEVSWEKISFDHNVDTDFLLKGAHSQISCVGCHGQSGFKKIAKSECVDCHQNDDDHNGENGKQCDSCHSEERWNKIIFDHENDTDFILLGKHAQLTCQSCHLDGTSDVTLGTACIDCHQVDDIHQGQQGERCENCHNSSGWLNKIRFNHDVTSFPLVGIHAVTSCDACHNSKAFNDAGSLCIDCHSADDFHDLGLGPNCGSCHNPNDWQLWLFDHDIQTDFKLEGAHESLSCNECHSKPSETAINQNPSCGSCHLNDDVHNKRFGRDCERCHTTKSFRDIRVR